MALHSKVTSVSVDSDSAERLNQLSDNVGESAAMVMRQVIRVAISREWTAEKMKLDNSRPGDVERSVLRLALSPDLHAEVSKSAGGVGVSRFFKASLERFIELHDLGDRSIWNLIQ